MPRPKTLPDQDVLEAALTLMHLHGPEGLTFASLAGACGLSPAALVQRFGNKAGLKQSALLHAWDLLDQRTARLAAEVPMTPEGAIQLLTGLSDDPGGVEPHDQGLLLLREDLRDPVLRARGAAWKQALAHALNERFAGVPGTPDDVGELMFAQWQGALLWWGFDPRQPLEGFVEERLERFVQALSG